MGFSFLRSARFLIFTVGSVFNFYGLAFQELVSFRHKFLIFTVGFLSRRRSFRFLIFTVGFRRLRLASRLLHLGFFNLYGWVPVSTLSHFHAVLTFTRFAVFPFPNTFKMQFRQTCKRFEKDLHSGPFCR